MVSRSLRISLESGDELGFERATGWQLQSPDGTVASISLVDALTLLDQEAASEAVRAHSQAIEQEAHQVALAVNNAGMGYEPGNLHLYSREPLFEIEATAERLARMARELLDAQSQAAGD